MARGFNFNGTDRYVTLADETEYDVSPNGGSCAWGFWVNPKARTSRQVLFHRNGWFEISLEPDGRLYVTFAGGPTRLAGKVGNGIKSHVLVNLVMPSAIAAVTANVNVANLYARTDATFWTTGVDDSRLPADGPYLAYNRNARTFGPAYVIPDKVFTAGAGTVNTTDNSIDLGGHDYIDGTPVTVHAASGATAPTGLAVDGTVYYVGDAEGGKVFLFNSAANAVANGATGKINITGVGSGAITLRAREMALKLDSDLFPDGNEVGLVFAQPWQSELKIWVNGIRQELDGVMHRFNAPADSDSVINVGQYHGGSLFYDGLMNAVVYWAPAKPTDVDAKAAWNKGTEAVNPTVGNMTLVSRWAFNDNASNTTVVNANGDNGTASANTSTITVTSIDPDSYWENDRILKFEAAVKLEGQQFVIDHMEWDGSIDGSDDLVVKDGDDNEIWVVSNKIDGDRAVIYLDDIYDGLEVETIDAGTLYVYLK